MGKKKNLAAKPNQIKTKNTTNEKTLTHIRRLLQVMKQGSLGRWKDLPHGNEIINISL